jgi:hypothetical protein
MHSPKRRSYRSASLAQLKVSTVPGAIDFPAHLILLLIDDSPFLIGQFAAVQ